VLHAPFPYTPLFRSLIEEGAAHGLTGKLNMARAIHRAGQGARGRMFLDPARPVEDRVPEHKPPHGVPRGILRGHRRTETQPDHRSEEHTSELQSREK